MEGEPGWMFIAVGGVLGGDAGEAGSTGGSEQVGRSRKMGAAEECAGGCEKCGGNRIVRLGRR